MMGLVVDSVDVGERWAAVSPDGGVDKQTKLQASFFRLPRT